MDQSVTIQRDILTLIAWRATVPESTTVQVIFLENEVHREHKLDHWATLFISYWLPSALSGTNISEILNWSDENSKTWTVEHQNLEYCTLFGQITITPFCTQWDIILRSCKGIWPQIQRYRTIGHEKLEHRAHLDKLQLLMFEQEGRSFKIKTKWAINQTF